MLHWNATPPGIAALLRRLSAALAGSGFYLAGGTAIALREAHRVSVDLDLFSPTFADPDALIRRLSAGVPELRVEMIAARTLYVVVGETRASFFGYDYPLLSPPVVAEEGLLPLADLDDIAAMKLAAIASRGSRKDFVDLWVLMRRHRSLADYLDRYRTKYATRDSGHVVRSLVYFDDADREPPLRLLTEVDWGVVKTDLRAAVNELLESTMRGGA